MSVYATGVVGLSSNALGLIYSLNGAAIIVFQMPMTRLLEHFRLSFPARLVFGTALYTAGYFSLGFAHNAWMMAASVFIITLGEAAVMPSLYSGVSSLAPSGGTGRYMASLELTRGVGYAAGPYFGAMLFQAYSPQPLLLWGLLSLVGCGAAPPRPPHPPRTPPDLQSRLTFVRSRAAENLIQARLRSAAAR